MKKINLAIFNLKMIFAFSPVIFVSNINIFYNTSILFFAYKVDLCF